MPRYAAVAFQTLLLVATGCEGRIVTESVTPPACDPGGDADPSSCPILPLSTVEPVVPPDGPTFYVDANADAASGDGSSGAPFSSLAAAVDAIAPTGGTIMVEPGRYQGPLEVADVPPLLIQAAPGAVLDCTVPRANWELHAGAIYRTTAPFDVSQVFVDGRMLPRARYPRTGFLSVASDAPLMDVNTHNLTIPMQATDAAFVAGQGVTQSLVTLRIVDYWFNTAVVESVSTATSTLTIQATPPATLASECDPNCYFGYRALAGFGYFLENELWMMTSPGAWAYDPTTHQLYVWLPDSTVPSATRVSAATAQDCLSVQNASGLQVQGLTITGAGGVAIRIRGSHGTRWNQTMVTDVKKQAFYVGSVPFVLDESRVERTGSSAALGYAGVGPIPGDVIVESSRFIDIGMALSPRFDPGAVNLSTAGDGASRILNNYLARLSYVGVRGPVGAVIEGNTIDDACLRADDCGAIYSSGYNAPGQTVRRNIVRRATANVEGKSASRGPYPVAGIYLDDFAEDILVEDNVVSDTDIGVMLHNSFNCTLTDNQIFDTHRYGVLAQEDSVRKRYNRTTYRFEEVLDADGQTQPSMMNNRLDGNLFVDTRGSPLVRHSSYVGPSLDRLQAAFSGESNTYWNFYSPVVVSSTAGTFAFEDLTIQGLDTSPRRPDVGFFKDMTTVAVVAESFTASPENLATFPTWTAAGTVAKTVITCPEPSDSGGCLEVVGSSEATTLVISPTFEVIADGFYEVRAQLRSGGARMPVTLAVRRNGPTWESLDALGGQMALAVGPDGWASDFFYVRANGDVANARVDITIPIGGTLIVGNVRVRAVTVAPDPPAQHFQGLVNVDYESPLTVACPFVGVTCEDWQDPADTTTSFPVIVPTRTARALWRP